MRVSKGLLAVAFVIAAIGAVIAVFHTRGSSSDDVFPLPRHKVTGVGQTVVCAGVRATLPPDLAVLDKKSATVTDLSNAYPDGPTVCDASVGSDGGVLYTLSATDRILLSEFSVDQEAPATDVPLSAPLSGTVNNRHVRLIVPGCLPGQKSSLASIDTPGPASRNDDLRDPLVASLIHWVNNVRHTRQCSGPDLAPPATAATAPTVSTPKGQDFCGVPSADLPATAPVIHYLSGLRQVTYPGGGGLTRCLVATKSRFHTPEVEADFSLTVIQGSDVDTAVDFTAADLHPIPGLSGSFAQMNRTTGSGKYTYDVGIYTTTCLGRPLVIRATEGRGTPLPPLPDMVRIHAQAVARQMGCET